MCYDTLRLIYYFFHMENQELRFQLLLILRYAPFFILTNDSLRTPIMQPWR